MSENKAEEEDDKKEKTEKKTKEDEEKEAAEKADEESRKKRLVKGDYVVQVHIIEGRELKGRDFGATSDPMVEVHVLNEKKTTTIMKENLNPLWDERLTFDIRGLEPEDLNQGKCKVMVFDANMVRRNVLIGSFEFDLVSIYYKKNHELFNQWVALVDVTGEFEGVQGFLKVSIVVLGPGDEQYIHSDDEMLELTDLFKPLMPPSIDPDPWLLKVYVWRYEHMAVADRTSQTSDPYVQVEFAAAKVKTKPFKKKLTADVRKCLSLKIMEPLMGDQIKVWFKDWDIGVQEDDILGIKTFSWNAAKTSGDVEGYPTHWIHLYGAPDLESGDLAEKMNKGIIEGCWYRGSVLLRLFGKHIEEGEEAESKQEVTDAIWNEAMAPATDRWILQVDVYQAVEVLGGEGKFGIEMRIRNTGYKTEFVECEKGTVEWCEVLNLDLEGPKLGGPRDDSGTITLSLPKDPQQCPDVIFYLTKKKEGLSAIGSNVEYISYRRFKWTELVKLGFASPPQWYEFFPSDVLHQLKDDEFPGTVLLGVRCGTESQNMGAVNPKARPFLSLGGNTHERTDSIVHEDSLSEAHESASLLPGGALETMGKLTITVLKASDVPSVDMNGKADPYVKVIVNGETTQTEPQKGTLNPQWTTGNKFVFEGVSIHDDITLELWDWNRLKDTFVGKKDNILLTGLLQEAGKGASQDFSTVKSYIMDAEKYKGAKVTVSFQWDFDPRQKLKRKARPQPKIGFFQKDDKGDQIKARGVQIMGRPYRKNYAMKVYAYCARDLTAADGNGLSDPYLEVSYCGVKEKTAVKNKTLNPQWMQELTLNVDVPQPAEYAPRVRCAVYDWDQLGSNDLLARFFIPFKTIKKMEKTKKAEWFPFQDKMGNKLEAKGVYLAVELVDPNVRNHVPLFTMDYASTAVDLHFLVIGVRELKSSLGVSKPQLVSTVPIAGDMVEVATDPSSDPSPKDANWLVIKKMTLDLPKNFELAPVVSLVIRDNKFGGLIKHDIGNAPLKIDEFMEKIDEDGTDWVVKDTTRKILDEKELHTEIKAEEEAEWRAFQAEKRVRELALGKTKGITEARCTLLPYDMEMKHNLDELEKKELEILTMEQIDTIKLEEAEKKSSALAKALGPKGRGAKPNEMDAVPDESESDEESQAGGLSDVTDAETNAETDTETGSKPKDKDKDTSDVDLVSSDETEDKKEEKKYENPDDELKRAQEEQEKQLAEQDKLLDGKEEVKDEEKKDGEVDEKKKKKKKKSQKQKDDEVRKNAEKLLKEWDTEAEEFCFDIDSKVPYNPEDFEPEYLKGRRKVKNELEDAQDLDLNPFSGISLWTGQTGGLKLFGQNRRQVGTLKGLWKLTDHSANEKNPFGQGLKSLLQTKVVACRLYILNGIHLVSTDNDNSSDPYLVVKLGRESFSTRSRYLANTLEPKFHEKFEFRTRLPGPSQVTIEVWDWDGIGDDLVGVTVVDIEDRWFSRDWRRLRVKPLEERTLWNPRSQASFGKLRLWVDLLNQDDARNVPMIDISLPPKEKFEMRLIVWKAQDVVIKDELTDQNDLRVTCKLKLEDWQEQETDTHWRAKFGKGSWNWRCVYPVELPIDVRTQLSMSMWDQDVFAASDSIGEVNIALDLLLKQAYLQRVDKPRLILRKDQTKRFWLDFTHPNFTGVQAKCQISMELMSAEEAAKFPAGIGRSDPNNNPFLPPPEGRLYWSWNPLELLRQLLGNKLCFKLYLIFYCLACAAIVVFIGPQFFVNFFSSLLLKAV